jgi:hypothetical protein
MAGNEDTARKAVAFASWARAIATPECPLVSIDWFARVDSLVPVAPASAAIGLVILGRHYTDIKEPTIALPLLLKGQEVRMMTTNLEVEEEKDPEKKKELLQDIEDIDKGMRDLLAKLTSEARTTEFVTLLDTIAKLTLNKK